MEKIKTNYNNEFCLKRNKLETIIYFDILIILLQLNSRHLNHKTGDIHLLNAVLIMSQL